MAATTIATGGKLKQIVLEIILPTLFANELRDESKLFLFYQ